MMSHDPALSCSMDFSALPCKSWTARAVLDLGVAAAVAPEATARRGVMIPKAHIVIAKELVCREYWSCFWLAVLWFDGLLV